MAPMYDKKKYPYVIIAYTIGIWVLEAYIDAYSNVGNTLCW